MPLTNITGDNNALIAGADFLVGGIGDDLLEGDGGAGGFVFNPHNGADTSGRIDVDYDALHRSVVIAADFVVGVDIVAWEGFEFTESSEALAGISDIDGIASFRSHGTDITFFGLTEADLTADTFAIV